MVFSTSEIDLVSEMLDEGQDLLKMYSPPFPVQSTITGRLPTQNSDLSSFTCKFSHHRHRFDVTEPEQEAHSVDMGSSEKPRTTCAEACLREKVCVGFVYSDTYYDCKWFTEESLANRQNAFTVEDKTKPSKYMFYTKNLTKVRILKNLYHLLPFLLACCEEVTFVSSSTHAGLQVSSASFDVIYFA